ncbi:DUF397 domain-containing protein [Streptomyces sp. ODS28]|uniref:DUF397 domain-containing protein n=1 Tax=Streptomyces sp. ODS28 TaxID=3136688 RepID=UPI0031E8ABA9
MTTTENSSLARWRKSSYSDDKGGSCVEVADLPGRVAVRDSKDPGRGHLTFEAPAFAAFIRRLAG